ncbi:MAG: tetratricopeptide repeat protein [Xenococcaceae cyanobacterium]
MRTRQPLERTLKNYEQALKKLEIATPPLSQKQILDVLVARDAVEAALTETTQIPTSSLLKLDELDSCLREQTKSMEKVVDLAHWRGILKPSAEAWWWFCETPTPPPWWERYHWGWNFLTLASLTASVSLVVDTSSRFLSGGINTLGAFAIVTQSVLTLLAGGLNIPKGYWQVRSSGIALGILLILIGFRLSLPTIAIAFNKSGVENYEAGRLDSALSDYQRAIALRPDYAQAHYNLGLLYEDLQELDKAKAEYQLVVQSDPDSLELLTLLNGHNNLGRVYILKKDYTAAVPPLLKGLDLVDEEAVKTDEKIKGVKYALLKNLGWTQLKQKHYVQADALLREAIGLYQEKAPAHCLLAQVLASQDEKETALKSWKACIQYIDINQPDEYQWLSLARERIAAQREKRHGSK